MAFSVLNHVKISGISAVVPEKEISLLDDKNLYDGDKRRIDRVIKSSGFLKRRVCDKNTMSSDLCEQAAEKLFEDMKIDRESIDAVVFVSYTPDYLMPATAYVLHKKLGLSENCLALDMPQACSGFVLGLYQAGMLLNAHCRRVLLLVGECFSKFTDMFSQNTAPVFGDAGTATLLEYSNDASPMYFNFLTDSNEYDALICRNGGFRNPPVQGDFYDDGSYRYDSSMDGGRVFEFTVQKIAPSISSLLKFANQSVADIDVFVLHQANRFILKNIAEQLNADFAKVPMSTLTNYGNQCGASIPCAISDNLSESVSSQSQNMLLSGFGVGLSIANAIVKTNKIYCSGICNYKTSFEQKG